MSGTQLAFLVLRQRDKTIQTSASLPADLLSLISMMLLLVLSILNHQRSYRSSSIVAIYLSAYTLLGAPRVRTLWLITSGGPASVTLMATLVLAAAATAVDSIGISTCTIHNNERHSPELYSGFWNRAVFAWLMPTLRAGYARVLSSDDVPRLDPKIGSDPAHHHLLSAWENCDCKQNRHSLLRACFSSTLSSFLSAIIPRLCLTAFTFSQPFLLTSTVLVIGERPLNLDFARGLIGGWALVFLGLSAIQFSNSIYQYQNSRFVTRLQGGLTALVYQHALEIRGADQGKITAMAILGADMPQIVAGLKMLHEIWVSLLEVAIAAWLLERKISLAFLAPLLVVCIVLTISTRLSARSKSTQKLWLEKVQARLKATTTLLSSIKSIKMMGLTGAASNIIEGLRQEEIKASTTYRKVFLAILVASGLPRSLAPAMTFVVFVFISVYWKGSTLEVSQAFTSLTLIALLAMPTTILTQVVPRVIQCLACFDRIQEYCNYGKDPSIHECAGKEGDQHAKDDESTKQVVIQTLELSNQTFDRSDDHISLTNANFKWTLDGSIVLKNVNLDITPGTFTAIVGPTGSGKTTLVESILGETISEPPIHYVRPQSIAYCSQNPWLENLTIRETITGANAYDENWYKSVLTACELERELAERGDFVRIEGGGINLSGGQNHRIALARAVYAKSKVVLLDDIFSSMDASTVDKISDRLLRLDGILRRSQRTVVLATSHRKLISLADRIITLESGRVVECRAQDQIGNEVELLEEEFQKDVPDRTRVGISVKKAEETMSASTNEKRKKGDLSIYIYYFVNSGRFYLAGYLLCRELTDWHSYLDEMVVGEQRSAPEQKGWNGITRSHGVDLWRTSAFPSVACYDESTFLVPFYDQCWLANQQVNDPSSSSAFVIDIFSILVKMIILCIFSRYLGIVVPILGIAVYLLQRFYLRTSRQVRLLGIEAKSPLYSHFNDSVRGAVTIRAFGWQAAYRKRAHQHIDTFLMPEYLQSCIQNWLKCFLDLIVAILGVALVATVVIWHDRFNPGSVGVSLLVVIGFSTTLSYTIQMWTSLESSIGAVTRVKQFVDETENEDTLDDQKVPPDWPQTGSLRVQALRASYSLGQEPVLKGISMSVAPKEHIAICGRSGSGKTSLVLAMLKMLPTTEGQIVIDNIDIALISCSQLRRAVKVISQDPLLLPGTFRFNMDPTLLAPDQEMIRVLKRVGLWDIVSQHGGLDSEVDTSAWSAGQKQLFCFTRVMIKKGHLLILDEATSSVDLETSVAMQEIIDSEFKDFTVLSIMHRLDQVMKYDKVAVFDQGELVEFDEPGKLIAQDSRFAELWKLHKSEGQGAGQSFFFAALTALALPWTLRRQNYHIAQSTSYTSQTPTVRAALAYSARLKTPETAQRAEWRKCAGYELTSFRHTHDAARKLIRQEGRMGIAVHKSPIFLLAYLEIIQARMRQQQKWLDVTTDTLCRSDINWLIMDYLVSEGYPGAAEKFAQETNICSPADMDSIRERVRIRNAIHAGRIDEAVEMINEVDSEILDDNHHLHFDLLQLQIIEMIRAIINKPGSFQVSEFKPVLEAATYQLAPRAPTDQKYQQAVDRTMSLMVFPVEKMPPEIKELLDLKLREKVANNVNKYILEKRGERSEAKIFNLVRARAWAEAQAREAKVDLPQNIPIGLDGDATAQVAGDVMVQ
ncbi:hypothetical protein AC578_9376 [Pseudocercospora eumusae]|uniref:ABC transporter domain-containing protein n=1 Tax=Pseudocercospora eumusae TaxID=321146 RepID=A0A139H1S2_9PEZI|nr:hypothetical protein AC578_9376 [Pseudocercospora eumusae]